MLPDEEILTLLGKYADEITNRLRMVQSQAARPEQRPKPLAAERYLWKRIADNLIAAYQTELDWVRQTQQELQEGKFSA